MAWPTIAVATKLTPAKFAAMKAYIDTDLLAAQAAYAPVIKFGTTVYAGGSRDFRWKQVGKRVWVSGQITLSGSAPAAGAIEISLPVAARLASVIGPVVLVDASPVAMKVANARAGGSIMNLVDDSGAYYTNTVPWTWANGDVIIFELQYEAA